MEHTLSNGKTITFDPNESLPNPQAESLRWLEERLKNSQPKEAAMAKDLSDHTDDELYAELDKISVEKARLGRKRDQYTDHTRRYWNDRRRQVAGELKRRKLPVRKRGSRKTLATAAHLAVRGRELAGEAA